ncbi:MAG: isoprenylcysteine carboxylmethyltransferase family protein [Caldisphaeraceae archaeon]|nr:isoprenylcysteine carboxylmethyltransferase family protein [Caldisphaeraceae archaeon]
MRNEKALHIVFFTLYLVVIIISIVSLRPLTTSLTLVGLLSIIFGLTLIALAARSRGLNRRPQSLIKENVYSIIRHPEYLGHIMILTGFTLMSKDIVTLALSVFLIASLYYAATAEERELVKIYGEDYLNYSKRVPRMNLILGLLRKLKSKDKS